MKSELQCRIERKTDSKWHVSISQDGSSVYTGLQSTKRKALQKIVDCCSKIQQNDQEPL